MQQLEAAVPDSIDVYFENVGGAISDEVFKHLNRFARIPVCGAISAYNNEKDNIGPRIQGTLIKNQAIMQCFVVAQWAPKGKIKFDATIDEGFDNLPSAFRKLFTGDNFDKQVVKIKEE